MNEIQRVVDELRFILQREVLEKTDELTTLVQEYSQLCHEVNARLRRCDECVKQGLRSEALHLAEATPNLLDAVAVLDFAERSELLDLIAMYFMTPPEPLLLEVATALNVAYAEHAPLEKLLDMHRLLSLGRSPLNQRLTVLRSLAELDSASPHWEMDIREMERARFRELDAESAAASKSGTSAVSKSLVGEIQAEGWREPIPAALTRDVKSRANQTIRSNARQRMQELNEQLYAAFSALDPATARPLREEWKQAQRLVQVDKDDPLYDQMAPIFDWLDDEDRKVSESQAFSKVVADIERALDNEEITSVELKRLKLTVDRLERGLPSTLETRFRSRLNTVEVIEGRRRKLMVGAGVSAVAVLVSAIGFIMYLSVEGEKTRRLVSAATDFIDGGKLEEAQKMIEQQSRGSTSEAWLEVKRKLADAEQVERDRVLNWKAEIATVRESTETISVEAAIKRARELSRTAEEKIEVGQLQATWQKRANAELALREKSFREGVAAASDALKALDAAIVSAEANDSDRVGQLLDAADLHVSRLIPLRNSVAKELASQGTLLELRLNALRKTMSDLARKEILLDKITDASLVLPEHVHVTAKVGAYEAALREFGAALPNDPRVVVMKSAAENSPIPAAIARQKMIERWKRFRPADKKDVETRLQEVRSFFTEYPQSPDRELLGQYETWLASVLRRFEDEGDPDEGVQRKLANLFNSKFIKDGYILQDKDGHTYYLTKAQAVPFGSIASFPYVIGFNGETRRDSPSLKPDQLLTPISIAPPQQELAAKVRATIRDVNLDGWRDYFRELTETLLKADKVDPFLRYLLVFKSVEFAGRGDHLLELELAPVLERLNDDELDRSVPWMDPKSETAKGSRLRAGELLAKIPPLEPIFKSVTKRQEQFERELFALRFSVGWLEKKLSHGEWVCRTKWSPAGDHQLHVVSRPDAIGARTWILLGRIHGKSLTVDSEVAKSVGEGAVVFASAASNETKTAQAP